MTNRKIFVYKLALTSMVTGSREYHCTYWQPIRYGETRCS